MVLIKYGSLWEDNQLIITIWLVKVGIIGLTGLNGWLSSTANWLGASRKFPEWASGIGGGGNIRASGSIKFCSVFLSQCCWLIHHSVAWLEIWDHWSLAWCFLLQCPIHCIPSRASPASRDKRRPTHLLIVQHPIPLARAYHLTEVGSREFPSHSAHLGPIELHKVRILHDAGRSADCALQSYHCQIWYRQEEIDAFPIPCHDGIGIVSTIRRQNAPGYAALSEMPWIYEDTRSMQDEGARYENQRSATPSMRYGGQTDRTELCPTHTPKQFPKGIVHCLRWFLRQMVIMVADSSHHLVRWTPALGQCWWRGEGQPPASWTCYSVVTSHANFWPEPTWPRTLDTGCSCDFALYCPAGWGTSGWLPGSNVAPGFWLSPWVRRSSHHKSQTSRVSSVVRATENALAR